jgi:hypothetical protein
MPGLNQAGPMGQGPMTGRRMGRCTNCGANLRNQNNTENEDSNKPDPDQMAVRGWGMGGRGRGRGRGIGQQNRFRGGF